MKIKLPLSINLRKLLYSKRFTITLSVLLSFIIWLSVIIKQNPVRNQVFTGIPVSIPIENTVLSDMGIGIVSDITSQTFTVTISGPNYVVSSIKPEDFILSVPLTDVTTAGTYTLDIVGNSNSDKSGYTFASISPSTIDVTFDYIDTKEYTVEPKVVGVKATEGLVAGTPALADTQNSTITIKGPRTVVDKIGTVNAVATTDTTLDKTATFDADIVICDKDGVVIYRYGVDGKIYDSKDELVEASPLTLSFTSVKVSQPVLKKTSLKILPVFSNLPSGMSNSDIKYTLSHTTVNAIGTPEVIEKLSEISLSAIDFRGISTTTNSFEVSAVLPDGVKLTDNIEFFTVKINTAGYSERIFTVSDFKLSGLAQGLTVKSTAKIRNVKLCGPNNIMRSITADELFGVVDLTDKVAGEYTVDVVIKSDKNNKFWQVGNYTTNTKIVSK